MIHKSMRVATIKIYSVVSAACLITLPVAVLPQQVMDERNDVSHPPAALFADTAPLEMEMRLDFDDICLNPEAKDCPDVPAEIFYRAANGSKKRLAVNIRTRGRWKETTGDCSFPAIFVYFTPGQTRGTVFEGEAMLPLTTHCKHHKRRYETYVLTEYLAHRLYQLLAGVSLRARLLHVTYVDADTDRRRQRYAFFTEHFERLAQRTDKEFYLVRRVDLKSTIPEEMATLALFQFMIGNLDWSAYACHNIAVFRDANGSTTPVPYDFDFSGIVDAEYATPPERFNQRNVRIRRYRGYCWPDLDWSVLFEKFQRIRDDVFKELAAVPGLSKFNRRRVDRYIRSFYKIIDSEEKRRKQVIKRCRKRPHPVP
ncbi:MAG: hypothetical protein ACR2RB_02210 [Gammaproteobacteria bacterium]